MSDTLKSWSIEKVTRLISSLLKKNQGIANAGKFMKVGADGELTPENVPDPTNKADKVTNATAGNFAGLDATGNLTDSGKSAEDFAGAIYKTATPGSIVTIDDGADDLPIKELKVAIEPVQDLHGYDHPWPAGGGVNKFVVGRVNVTSNAGITATINDDLCSITINGTATKDGSIDMPVSGGKDLLYGDYYYHCDDATNRRLLMSLRTGGQSRWINSGTVITVGDNDYPNYVHYSFSEGETFNNKVVKLQLNSPATVTEWTPYSNICPITGWTGAKVTRTGVNVWDEGTKKGYYSSIDGSFVSYYGQLCSKNPIHVRPSTKYFYYKNTALGDVLYYGIDGSYLGSNINLKTNREFTTPENCYFIQINIGSNYGATYNNDVSINYPSTDTQYHAYSGETYNITFPSEAGTVYGGTLNPVTGELVVDRAEVDLGTLNYSKSADFYYADAPSDSAPVISNGQPIICEIYKRYVGPLSSMPDFTAGLNNVAFSGAKVFYCKDSRFDNASDFKAAMSGVVVVYPLATPVTYQLTAQEIRTLLGVNNIWADTGDITELIYPVNTDTAMALYEKADKVANATAGNFAALDAEGNLKDSGKKPGDFLTEHQDISGKADKVSGATNGNFAGLDANGNLTDSGKKPSDILTQAAVVDLIYPVGSIYMSASATSPATLFVGTTWEQLKDRFLLGVGDTYTAGDTGGNASHTLTIAEMPSHNHTFTGSAVDTGNQSADHTHTYTDYYATTTGGTAISVAQMHSHTHDNRGHNVWTGQNSGYGSIMSDSYFSNTFAGTAFHIQYQGSNNSHTHSGANTSTTRTSNGISANHTHSVTASGTIGNSGDGIAFSIIPPYLAVYMWKRTA